MTDISGKDSTTNTRSVTPVQFARLVRKTTKRPVVALMGEFSAGKSTLLNFLLDRDALPMKVTATELPPIWLSYGQEAPYRIDAGGRRRQVVNGDLTCCPIDDTRFIRIFCESEILKKCDLIDMPGISDPNLDRKHWIKTTGYADFVVWCTHATQAWRQSEKSVWTSLPKRLRRNSILAVTRADKLVSPEDRGKVMRRIQRETLTLFNDTVMLSSFAAKQAKHEFGVDSKAWHDSGATEFYEALDVGFSSILEAREGLLARYNQPHVMGTDDAATPAPVSEPETTVPHPNRVRPRRVVRGGECSSPRLSQQEAQDVLAKTGLTPAPVLVLPEPVSDAADIRRKEQSRLVLTKAIDATPDDDAISKVREALLQASEETLTTNADIQLYDEDVAPVPDPSVVCFSDLDPALGGRGDVDQGKGHASVLPLEFRPVMAPPETVDLERDVTALQLVWRKAVAEAEHPEMPQKLVDAIDHFLSELSAVIGPRFDEDLQAKISRKEGAE
ncbi:MAG: dynamin family protein [Halocynthiibacter sp.]